MKSIIEGKRYDTEAAQLVASFSYGGPGDFHYFEETLYLTSKGAWFIRGGGGPMSRYAQKTAPNETSGSVAILPLTEDEAKTWLEKHDEVDALEEHFADEFEDA